MGSVERRCPCGSGRSGKCGCPSRKVRWRAVLRLVGGRKLSRTFGTQFEAKTWLAQQETAYLTGSLGRQGGGDVAFRDWVDEWLATRAIFKPSTQANDRGRLPELLDAFGDLPLRQITPTLVRQWMSELSDRLAPKTVRHYHSTLYGIMQLAVDEGLVGSNPCRRTPLPELAQRGHLFLTEDEAAALIAAHPSRWRPLPILLLGTGLRWAEAVGLRCRNVDQAKRLLTVRETWSDHWGWQTPKTPASRRTIDFGQPVAEALDPLLRAGQSDMPVLRAARGGMVRHSVYVPQVWRPALARAGLADRGFTPHTLRHTHATWLIAANVPLSVIQRRMGHKSIVMTSDIYGGIMPRLDAMAVAALDLALGTQVVPDVVPENL